MATTPNNPFEKRSTGESPVPAKSSKKGRIIGFLIACVIGMFVCCGGTAVLVQIGMGALASEYERQLQGNPVIEEHIGQIESFENSWRGMISEAQNVDEPGTETPLAFEVEGSKGSGTVLIIQDKGGDGTGIASATLVMEDGSRHPLDVGYPPSAADDIDLEGMFDSGVPDTGEPSESNDGGASDSESNDGGASDSDSSEQEAEANPVAPAETN